MYLYLVRHGESVGNAEQLFFGWKDYPLTERGREQAEKAAEKLRAIPFRRCCASDLSRAWETALICTAGREIEPERCPDLREQHLGALEGMTWEEAQDVFADALEAYLQDWRCPLPTAEPYAHMLRRVSDCVQEIMERGEDTLIVAHNGSLTLILSCLGLIGERELTDMSFQFRFGCFSAVRIDNTGTKLTEWNR